MPSDEFLSLGLGHPNFSFVKMYLLIYLSIHHFFLLVLYLIPSGVGYFVGKNTGCLACPNGILGLGGERERGAAEKALPQPPPPARK